MITSDSSWHVERLKTVHSLSLETGRWSFCPLRKLSTQDVVCRCWLIWKIVKDSAPQRDLRWTSRFHRWHLSEYQVTGPIAACCYFDIEEASQEYLVSFTRTIVLHWQEAGWDKGHNFILLGEFLTVASAQRKWNLRSHKALHAN